MSSQAGLESVEDKNDDDDWLFATDQASKAAQIASCKLKSFSGIHSHVYLHVDDVGEGEKWKDTGKG